MIASDNGYIFSWMASWVGVHVLLQLIALVNIARHRHVMETRLIVKWTLLVVLVPVLGLLGYFFYLIEDVIHANTMDRGRQEDAAPLLQNPSIQKRPDIVDRFQGW